eukprot:gnl/MRDRNA2_/MRDRNA2_98457_c0_seq1.p1 gnl/MRDRNA2_/MRDRNA2_98457_c0~~gnl/MRDRNA2_/MRDRNA2_98457_c0_seq1.p1  ORF type:complete len:138 (-),score=37.94 gnl/MRDRNA2_/MRDRNA2_98457_c0_seq1:11-424(-)
MSSLRIMCLVAVMALGASAKPFHPKRFIQAMEEDHKGYVAKRYVPGSETKKLIGLLSHRAHGTSKAPWDVDSDDEYDYGEHPEADSASASSDYSVSQFINTDEAQSDDDDDTDKDSSSSDDEEEDVDQNDNEDDSDA